MKKKFLVIISGASGGIGKLLIKNLSKKFKILYLYNRKKPNFLNSSNCIKIDYAKPSKIKVACIKLKKLTLKEKKIIFLTKLKINSNSNNF